MECRDKILSNDYFDILTDFPVSFVETRNLDQCVVSIDNLYTIVYLRRSELSNEDAHLFDYKSVPKLYGLMQQETNPYAFDPNSMIVSGIAQVQTPAAPAVDTDQDSPEAIEAQAKADVAAYQKMMEVC